MPVSMYDRTRMVSKNSLISNFNNYSIINKTTIKREKVIMPAKNNPVYTGGVRGSTVTRDGKIYPKGVAKTKQKPSPRPSIIKHMSTGELVRAKYPRTPHLPNSLGRTSDDIGILSIDQFIGKRVIISEKLDGEATTIYSDGYCHARSIDGRSHPSQSLVRSLASFVAPNIPHGWRICGENLYAVHSLAYKPAVLPSYFCVYSIWDENDNCLSWDETVEYCELLDLKTVPVLFDGICTKELLDEFPNNIDTEQQEGFVVRLASNFSYSLFDKNVAKWVRPSHVQTDDNWSHGSFKVNGAPQE